MTRRFFVVAAVVIAGANRSISDRHVAREFQEMKYSAFTSSARKLSPAQVAIYLIQYLRIAFRDSRALVVRQVLIDHFQRNSVAGVHLDRYSHHQDVR